MIVTDKGERNMAHGEIAKDKVRISFVIPKDLKDELTDISELEERSLSNMFVRILRDYVNRNRQNKQQEK